MGLFTLLAIGLILAWFAGVTHVILALTHPPKRGYAWALARNLPSDPSELDVPLPFESWRLRWRGLELPVWDIRGGDADGHTVIMTHGWGESRVMSLSRISAVAPMAARIIAWDLPGHGDARGRCSLGTHEVDALLALIEHVGGEPVVLMGWSLGAGVSIAAAARRPGAISHLIAEAPYRLAPTPARNVMRLMHMPHRSTLMPAMWWLGLRFMRSPTWRGRDGEPGFDRQQHAQRLACPLLVLHGEMDEVCPVQDGRDIAAVAKNGQFALIEGGAHQSLWDDAGSRTACVKHVARFLGASRGAPPITSRSDARSS